MNSRALPAVRLAPRHRPAARHAGIGQWRDFDCTASATGGTGGYRYTWQPRPAAASGGAPVAAGSPAAGQMYGASIETVHLPEPVFQG